MKVELNGQDVKAQYGLIPLSWEGQWSRPATKPQYDIRYTQEPWQITKPQARDYVFRGVFECADYEELIAKVGQFRTLVGAPGILSVAVNENEFYSCFCEAGFTVRQIIIGRTVTAVLEANFKQGTATPILNIYAIIDQDDNELIDDEGDVLIY